MTLKASPQMALAREYLTRADGLWRRHKARAVVLAAGAAACVTAALVKQGVMWAVLRVRPAAGRTDER